MKGFLDGAKELKANSANPMKAAQKVNSAYQQLDGQMKGLLMAIKKCGAMNPEMQAALSKIMAGTRLSLSLSLSVCVCVCVSVCLSVCLSPFPSFYLTLL